MRKFTSFFLWAAAAQIGINVILMVLVSITRYEPFGWIPASYIVVAGSALQLVYGTSRDVGWLSTIAALLLPFIIYCVVLAGIASIIARFFVKSKLS